MYASTPGAANAKPVFCNCTSSDLAAFSSAANAFTASLPNLVIALTENAAASVPPNFLTCLSNTFTSCLAFLRALPFQVAEAATNILATMPPS